MMSQDHTLSEEDICFYASLGVQNFVSVISVLKDDCHHLFDETYTSSRPFEYILEAFVFAKEELHGWWPVLERLSLFPETTPAEIGLMTGSFNELLSKIEEKEYAFMCTLTHFNKSLFLLVNSVISCVVTCLCPNIV